MAADNSHRTTAAGSERPSWKCSQSLGNREVRKRNDSRRALDLVIGGNDISHYVGPWANCERNRAEWTVHTELVANQHTSAIFRPLNHRNRNVLVKYRLRPKGGIGPWRSGHAEVAWRLTETGSEELILHGIGLLDKTQSTGKIESGPRSGLVTKSILAGGKVIHREKEVEATISTVEEDPERRATREAQLQFSQEAEIRAVTSPEFILFLANSALSSYRS